MTAVSEIARVQGGGGPEWSCNAPGRRLPLRPWLASGWCFRWIGWLGGVAGEGEEDVVQGGPTHRKVGQGEAGGVQLSHDLGQDGHTVGDEDGHLAGLGVHLRGPLPRSATSSAARTAVSGVARRSWRRSPPTCALS